MLTAISFIFVFGLIVFVHELGHFVTAKMSGVHIHEFSLGMGPAIFKKQKGETLYALRAFPIGGYVKMEGEDGESEDPRSFSRKKPWQRLIILAAGALMNFVLAYILLIIVMFSLGAPSTTLESVVMDKPAALAGIMANDQIIVINGEPVSEWEYVTAKIGNSQGEQLTIIVKRGTETLSFDVIPVLSEAKTYQLGIQTKMMKDVDQAFVHATQRFGMFFTDIFKFFSTLGSKTEEAQIVGPVGLVKVIGDASQQGILNLLFLAAYISINLGIINLLPFPALDGGRIIFVLIEMIMGRPVNREKEGFVHFIGFAILMGLMVYLVFNDISNLR